uniref:Acylaminoacyl-peptidase-related n=1 Tax=Arundo donax TaxID=35708 RepID=A0A0A9E7F8_ARUDO
MSMLPSQSCCKNSLKSPLLARLGSSIPRMKTHPEQWFLSASPIFWLIRGENSF